MWSTLDVKDVQRKLKTSINVGLTEEEAQSRVIIIKSLNCFMNFINKLSFFPSANLFSPYCFFLL